MNTPDLTRLYAEHGDAVHSMLLRLVGPAEAEDLMQEVFVKAGGALKRFRGEADPRTWLHRIARNTAFDHLRSRGHRERMRTDPLAAPGSDGPVALALAEPPKAPGDLQRSDMSHCIAGYLRQLRPVHDRCHGFLPGCGEYAALGAAIGANCEPCLRFHVREALKVGLSLDDIARAIEVAERVKATPAGAISKLAERLTHPDSSEPSASGECGCASHT